jgi:hypothetical protein
MFMSKEWGGAWKESCKTASPVRHGGLTTRQGLSPFFLTAGRCASALRSVFSFPPFTLFMLFMVNSDPSCFSGSLEAQEEGVVFGGEGQWGFGDPFDFEFLQECREADFFAGRLGVAPVGE